MQEHIQQQLMERYRQARRFYEQPGVRDAALVLGIGHREYCDRFVRDNFPSLTWASNTADNWQPDPDTAYRAAGSMLPPLAAARAGQEGE